MISVDIPGRGSYQFAHLVLDVNGTIAEDGHLIPGAPDGIREGATVHAGQTIGWMGNTGNSTGAHLHWGIWLDGEPVNPRYFL